MMMYDVSCKNDVDVSDNNNDIITNTITSTTNNITYINTNAMNKNYT